MPKKATPKRPTAAKSKNAPRKAARKKAAIAKSPAKRTAKKATKKAAKKATKKKTPKRKKRPPTPNTAAPPAKKKATKRKRSPLSDAAKRSNRKAAAIRSRKISRDEQEIGPIPPIADPARRAACEKDLPLALKTYFPKIFSKPFSPQHYEVIEKMRVVLQEGGLFALGMPRGSGKTSLATCCDILALLFGWKKFIVLLGPIQKHASDMLDEMKEELEKNDLLLADFPEVCYPIRELNFTPSRCRAQTTEGKHTHMQWKGSKRFVLPTVNGQGGATVRAVGVTGNIRGMSHRLPGGEKIRPDKFSGDDLQKAGTARSVEQVNKIEEILRGDVLGLAGPGQPISGFVTITVQRLGDLADRLLDRTQNPEYNGLRFALVEQWPTNERLWAEYAEHRDIDLANGDATLPTATEHYRRNLKAMRLGAVVPWKERFGPHEIDALQHAYNLKLKNPTTFDAEYQNQPTASISAEGLIESPTSDTIVKRIGGYARGEVPYEATRVFSAVDLQDNCLFWMVAAVDEDLSGWILDYGAWPDQPSIYWSYNQIHTTIQQHTGINTLTGGWFHALSQLIPDLMSRQYKRDNDAPMQIEKLIVDANYGRSTKTVYSWLRQQSSPILMPFHGKGYTAKQTPLAARKKKVGEQAGIEWFVPAVKGTREMRHIIADVNLIKTTICERLMQPMGEVGAWQLFKAPAAAHRMLADQLSAEYPVETEGRGRKLIEWILRPGRDNHWLDCAVMIATAALMAGCAAPGTSGATVRRPKRREYRELGDVMKPAR
ncbi:MAG: phage terminase large subunit family protein [Planctomycetales bacterium]|nr:phage terminase large subunit family protein [Planctomycetales bacterium]